MQTCAHLCLAESCLELEILQKIFLGNQNKHFMFNNTLFCFSKILPLMR